MWASLWGRGGGQRLRSIPPSVRTEISVECSKLCYVKGPPPFGLTPTGSFGLQSFGQGLTSFGLMPFGPNGGSPNLLSHKWVWTNFSETVGAVSQLKERIKKKAKNNPSDLVLLWAKVGTAPPSSQTTMCDSTLWH